MLPHNHPHPGTMLRSLYFDALALTVTDAASKPGVSRGALSRVLNGRADISPELALRLELAGLNEAGFWVNLQANYGLWRVMKAKCPKVKKIRKQSDNAELAV